MFIGENTYLISTKGKVVIPLRFMKKIRGVKLVEVEIEAYVAKSPDKCLCLFPKENWKEVKRYLKRSAHPEGVKIRKAGSSWKILISQGLREYAKLERSVVVAGCGDYIEIWNLKNWAEVKRKITGTEVQEDIFFEI